mgnify:CR=1 FL=1
MMKMGIVGTGMMLNFHYSAFSQLPNISVHGCTREYYGTKGGQNALNFLRSVRDMLAGSSNKKVNLSVQNQYSIKILK